MSDFGKECKDAEKVRSLLQRERTSRNSTTTAIKHSQVIDEQMPQASNMEFNDTFNDADLKNVEESDFEKAPDDEFDHR